MWSNKATRNWTTGTYLFPGTTGCLKRRLKNCVDILRQDHMARSDLLVSLVRAGTAGDKRSFRTAAEAIIAEERAKHHDVLADRLTHLIHSNGAGGNATPSLTATADVSSRGKDFISEIVPRRRLEDLILPDIVRRAVQELVEEQQR